MVAIFHDLIANVVTGDIFFYWANPGQPDLAVGNLAHGRGLELDDLEGLLQTKPFYVKYKLYRSLYEVSEPSSSEMGSLR